MMIGPAVLALYENKNENDLCYSHKNKILQYRWEIVRKRFLNERLWQAPTHGKCSHFIFHGMGSHFIFHAK